MALTDTAKLFFFSDDKLSSAGNSDSIYFEGMDLKLPGISSAF